MAGEIIAMGGGGFSMEPDNPRLDDFILSRARRQPARICFVPTASGDSASYIVRFYRAFADRPCVPTDLTLVGGPLERQPFATADLAGFVAEQDVIYVGGGNTANLLALWRAHGLDRILRDAWTAGAVLCGVSAGMICWFSAGVTDSYGALAPLPDGLGLVADSACPPGFAGGSIALPSLRSGMTTARRRAGRATTRWSRAGFRRATPPTTAPRCASRATR